MKEAFDITVQGAGDGWWAWRKVWGARNCVGPPEYQMQVAQCDRFEGFAGQTRLGTVNR